MKKKIGVFVERLRGLGEYRVGEDGWLKNAFGLYVTVATPHPMAS